MYTEREREREREEKREREKRERERESAGVLSNGSLGRSVYNKYQLLQENFGLLWNPYTVNRGYSAP